MTWLQCSECNEMFEISTSIAEAMHHWREESGDPYLCVECATHIAWGDAIIAMDGEKTAVGGGKHPSKNTPIPDGPDR